MDIATGEITGRPLFTIVDTEYWYAGGNFRETDLRGIKAGRHALVYVMEVPHASVKGVVNAIGASVSIAIAP